MIKKFIKEHQLLVAAVVVGLFIFFSRSPRKAISDASEVNAYKIALKAKEQEAASIAMQRDIYREWKDEVVAEKQKQDSLLQIKDRVQIVKYATIPVYVNSLGRDSLRAEVLRFAK